MASVFPLSPDLGTYYTNSGLSGTYIPEIWSGKLLEKFYLATVFGAISNTDYEGEISKYGDKVKIRTVPDITVSDYKVGMDLDYERPRSDNVELLIDKGKYYAFVMNDVEKKQADIAYIEKWSADAGEQMKIQIDSSILASVYASVDSSNAGNTAGAISGDIALGATGSAAENAVALTKNNVIDKVTECGLILDEQNCPESNRWMVLPAWACQRIKISDLKDASMTGDGQSTLRNGRIGMIDRFEVYSSNNVAISTETSTKCYNAIFGHKSAITFASQLVENEMIPNPNDFGKLCRGLQVYGFKVLQDNNIGHLYITKG